MRHRFVPATLLVTTFATLACGGLLQSYGAGLQVICDAPNTCGEPCAKAPPEMRLTMMAKHVDENLWNGDARMAFEAIAHASPEAKVEILRHEAAENGVGKCALADMIESQQREMWSNGVADLCAGCSGDSDPTAVKACVDKAKLPYEVKDAVQQMDGSSAAALGTEIQKLAAKHGQPACALAATLRNAN